MTTDHPANATPTPENVTPLHPNTPRDGYRREQRQENLEKAWAISALARESFTGDAIRRLLREEPPVSPLPGILSPRPSLHVLSGAPTTGKTTFGLYLAACWASGVAPWPGAPKLSGTRSAVITAEDDLRALADTAARLAASPETPFTPETWPDGIYLTGRTACSAGEESPSQHLLELGEGGGLSKLDKSLRLAQALGSPFGLIVLDSLSALKPGSLDENASTDMSPWLGKLNALAVERGVWVLLLHHPRKGASAGDAIETARGSGAIGAAARVVLGWEVPSKRGAGKDYSRRVLTVAGNSMISAPWTFRVRSDDAPERSIDGFDPELRLSPEDEARSAFQRLGATDPHQVSVNALAVEIARGRDPSHSGRPGGTLRKKAGNLLERFRAGELSLAPRSYSSPEGSDREF